MGIRADHIIYVVATVVTFIVCGFWHGAAWTFIFWGLLHGLFLIFEQLGLRKFLKRRIALFQHLYLLFFLCITWVIFRSPSLNYAATYLGAMFGTRSLSGWNEVAEFINPGLVAAFIVAVAGSTSLFSRLLVMKERMIISHTRLVRLFTLHAYESIILIAAIIMILLSSLFIIAGTNNSFIYFQF
jgi:alginate O-acetyltransferase complex protein AlgI